MDRKSAPHEQERLLRLDGLRGVAACAVAFAFHPQMAFRDGQFDAYGPIVNWFHNWGWTFVDLFFVLSGYVFAEVYLSGNRLSTQGGWRSFWVARIARLYPLHFATLALCAAVFTQKPENTISAFAAHTLMLQSFVAPVAYTFNGPSWSLSVEIICYILFAIGAVKGPKVLAGVTGAAIIGSLLYISIEGRPGGPWANEVLFRGLLGFFMGQVLWRGRAHMTRLPSWSLVLACTAGLFLQIGQLSPLLTLCLLAWPAALLLSLRMPLLERPVFLWLGKRSYAIYLIHQPVIDVVGQSFGKLAGGVGFVIAAHCVLAAITCGLAELSGRFLEEPLGQAIRGRYNATKVQLLPAAALT